VTEMLERVENGISALMYVALGAVLAVQARWLWLLMRDEPSAGKFCVARLIEEEGKFILFSFLVGRLGRRASPTKLVVFVTFVVFIFVTRSVLNLLVAFQAISLIEVYILFYSFY
jgi:hypothetical protein